MMALSDACFDFLDTVAAAAEELAHSVHHYAHPNNPLDYGSEIDALRQACAAVARTPYDGQAGARLLRLAAAVMLYHDTTPGGADLAKRQAEMKKLIRLLHSELDGEDEESIAAVVSNVVVETRYTKRAAERLKEMLPKLGKSTYDVVIKIIGDIGSATVKKLLGL